ncbi:MAG: HAMP domain-containing sensor histidine kinase [Arcobacter sp.]|jgi:signal transduction histidine kinase|uniref:sensor histidine kinase n=1 Tax=Arcobacter sp. TaxID=1872629 RepID=UPI00258ACB7F|nr:HAMP domain-containing sensor histidine kinase [Arcobacter sp.]MDD3009166.1 HAMP domain-containing sensor histidine kinase [Arcobacter sp.]MDY3205331.1 HAMP domain-containing sensor histidine kinase [Arcobacter sp.]
MKNKFNKLLNYFDNLNFKYKTAFLIFIIAGGMICIIILSQISIYIIKNDFDILFDKRTKSLMELENIKDTYQVNIQETLNDIEKKQISYEQANEVLKLGLEIINKNWDLYKNQIKIENKELLTTFIKLFIIKEENYYENNTLKSSILKNIDKKMQIIKELIAKINLEKNDEFYSNLDLEINALSIYLTSLINYDLSLAINEKRNTDKIFNIILIFSIISIFIVFLFSIILSFYIINHFKHLHNSLEEKVKEKTKELQELNNYLETKISKEVAQNRKKDIIMFQQARFASLGEMLNNIAHQWRQPLGSITMIIQSFQTKMSLGKLTPSLVEEKVNDALLLASNMSNTLDDFRNFFSPNKIKSEFSIKNCIEHSIELSKYFLNQEEIKVELKVRKDVKINSYYNELSHVFLNIISNSKDALSSNVDKNDRIIKIIVNKFKNSLVVNILDNGGGIPSEVLPKIFEPYYTTKYKSAGTGIGLYMSKQIIEKHMNGEIFCKNILHKIKDDKVFNCSLFTIKIPINDVSEKKNDK